MQDDPVYKLTLAQRAMVVLTIVLSTTIYAGSVLISSALLPQLQGVLSATQDEVSWVMTFNIVATAVATPMTGWLADRFGQRQIMIAAALFFGIATFMCGASNSLEELIFWRIVQGAAGAPLVPLGQTILLDSSPRSQQAAVMSIFGMANMIGPSLGPMFAGQVAETLGLPAIVCWTFSGSTALRVARERPKSPVVAISPNESAARKLAVVWGVHSVVAEDAHDQDDMVDRASRWAFRDGFAKAGQRILIVAGVPLGTPGATNMVRIAFVGSDAADET